ncbi:hypothetical protein ACN4EG_18930 [Alkalinema pantanalense CENA528]|uniref:hypothetical protein n=1 Tax=Alkalinema pantanalense TaxID=1620705 RepID=UPI003D6EFAB2
MVTQLNQPQPTASDRPDIHYPDSDGQPMADNTLQFQWIVTIKENLELLFANDANVFVAGDLLWYPVEGNNKSAAGSRCHGRVWPTQGLPRLLSAMEGRQLGPTGRV